MAKNLLSLLTVPVLCLSLAACGDDDGHGAVPLSIDAGIDLNVASCERVRLQPAITGRASDVRWSAAGIPLLLLEEFEGGTVEFTAPALAVATELRLHVVAERDGDSVEDDVTITIAAAAPQADLADGMTRACAPFTAGVASGDPLANGVVLWTYVDDDSVNEVRWQLARDTLFRDITIEGDAMVDRDSGTVHVEAVGLDPATTYYYRFRTGSGVFSELGRTRTAPAGSIEEVRFAVASCSSIYSGYFNAYRRIAERGDLDFVIHLGDYLYDFVDEQEQVRIPEPYPQVPQNLEEWRARHEYYLADPDLRMARAMHPWFLLWDNHDVEASAAPSYNGSIEAFRDWNPMRQPVAERPEIAYRKLAYGDLIDLFAIDILLFRNLDVVRGTNAPGILGDEQWSWLEPAIESSTATWRIFGMQKPFGRLRINPQFSVALGGEPRDIFDPGTWDGFPEDRQRFLDLLDATDHVDNLFLSGDSHISVTLNVVDNFDEPTRALGGEMLPTSISRGNFDETLGALAQPQFLNFLVNDTLGRNPHGVYLELTKHGYGTVAMDRNEVRTTYWYSDILARSDIEEEGPTFVMERGVDAWVPQ